LFPLHVGFLFLLLLLVRFVQQFVEFPLFLLSFFSAAILSSSFFFSAAILSSSFFFVSASRWLCLSASAFCSTIL